MWCTNISYFKTQSNVQQNIRPKHAHAKFPIPEENVQMAQTCQFKVQQIIRPKHAHAKFPIPEENVQMAQTCQFKVQQNIRPKQAYDKFVRWKIMSAVVIWILNVQNENNLNFTILTTKD
jgi:hypothetical protein